MYIRSLKSNIIRMKYLTLSIAICCLLACGQSNPKTSENPIIEQATKRIRQKIDAAGMGMIKDFKVYDVEQLNDSVFRATREFNNPMFDKDIKITEDYTFDSELNTIIDSESVKSYMKSEGEWVEVGI